MSQNKLDSLHVKKKWSNKHSYGYRCKGSGYGGYWTPPLTKSCSKRRKKVKKYITRKETKEWLEREWIDYEIEREFDYNDITQIDDTNTNNDIWICSTCSMQNIYEMKFCKQCNASYHGFQNETYIQFNYNVKLKKARKRKYKKRRKTDTYQPMKNKDTSQDKPKLSQLYDNSPKQHHIHEKYTHCKKKLLKKLSWIIKYIHKFAICMDLEPIINDRWLNKIDIDNLDKNILFTTQYKKWTEFPHQSVESQHINSKIYDKNTFKELLKFDPIISKCDNELLVYGYLRMNDNNIFIPYDIVCITTLLCGVITELLPYSINENKLHDIGQYYHCINETRFGHVKRIPVETSVYDAIKYVQNSECDNNNAWHSTNKCIIYLCVSLRPENNGQKYVLFNELIPIFKVSKNIGYIKLNWKRWTHYSRYHDKQWLLEKKLRKSRYVCLMSKELMIEPAILGHTWEITRRVGRYEKSVLEWYRENNNNRMPFKSRWGGMVRIWNITVDENLKREIDEFRKRYMDGRNGFIECLPGYYSNKEIFDPSKSPNVLKYIKSRSLNRIKSRKWSAYSKLINT